MMSKPIRLGVYVAGIVVFWTGVIACTLLWDLSQQRQQVLAEAHHYAVANFKKDLVYRSWAARQGGVYVPVSEDTPPNPHLAHLEEREITTPSGRILTLVNPAYMTRQVHELESQQSGIRGHITSLNPIRPENAPDPWEAEALRTFELGATEVSSIEELEGNKYLRLMRPLTPEQGCLKCHSRQGSRLGDISGGISVSVPMEPFWAIARLSVIPRISAFSLLWMIGLTGIGMGARSLRKRIRIQHNIEKELATRLRYEERLARFSQALLAESGAALQNAVSHLLDISGASRIYIFKKVESGNGRLRTRRIVESCTQGVESLMHDSITNPDSYKEWFPSWAGTLSQGHPIQGTAESFPRAERDILEAQGIQSILVLPVVVKKQWYGFIGFDDTRTRREWDRESIRLLQIATERIGTYLEQKESVKALEESKKMYRTIFDESKDMIITISVDGKVVDINQAGAEMLGFSAKSEVINTKAESYYLNPSDKEQFKIEMKKKGYVKDFEIIMKRRDGSKVIALENSTAVEDQSGNVIGYQSMIKDISERMETERLIWKTNMQLLETNKKLKQTQSQLVHQEKLASIGQLAAGVAHEINNPLGFVKSNFSTLKEYLHSIKEYIQTVNESLASKIINNREKLLKNIRRVAATEKELDIGYIVDDIESIFSESEDGFERIITIVQNLKNFSRVDSLGKVESYDLNKAIESTLTVARNEYKYIAEIEKHLSELPSIECVGSEINQVLLNIIVNAAQAM